MTSRIPISPLVPGAARVPAVVTWSRLEGSPRSAEFSRSLRAEVRDALWMLARQWQVGEFIAKDAGSPVMARVTTETESIATFVDARGVASQRDPELPLETRVERERVAGDLGFAIQAGHHWLRLLRARVGDDRYRDLFVRAYPISAGDSANVQVQQWSAAGRGRMVDGQHLVDDLQRGIAAASVTKDGMSVAQADHANVTLAQQDLLAWFARTASQPSDEQTWAAERLEYRFGIATRSEGGATTTLSAAEYHGGHLDWHDFDVTAHASSPTPRTKSLSLVPTPVTFTGMPAVRWWQVEDQRLDFGAIDAHPSDLATLLLAEFGLVYGCDWSIIPLQVAVGTLCRITDLVVTDVFGQQLSAPSLHDDSSPWAMFTLAGGAALGLFVPPALVHVTESAPIECVDVLRDEMANMVWAIETVIPDGLGGGVSGREHEVVEPSSPSSGPHYELVGRVPASWIPFIPTHIASSSREIQLQRGAMIGAGGTPVPPRGSILGAPAPYFVHEEEVSRVGVRITRTWQRARGSDGRTYVWIGRDRIAGRGEGASGLAFDQVKP